MALEQHRQILLPMTPPHTAIETTFPQFTIPVEAIGSPINTAKGKSRSQDAETQSGQNEDSSGAHGLPDTTAAVNQGDTHFQALYRQQEQLMTEMRRIQDRSVQASLDLTRKLEIERGSSVEHETRLMESQSRYQDCRLALSADTRLAIEQLAETVSNLRQAHSELDIARNTTQELKKSLQDLEGK